jgi:hypothetical protein
VLRHLKGEGRGGHLGEASACRHHCDVVGGGGLSVVLFKTHEGYCRALRATPQGGSGPGVLWEVQGVQLVCLHWVPPWSGPLGYLQPLGFGLSQGRYCSPSWPLVKVRGWLGGW